MHRHQIFKHQTEEMSSLSKRRKYVPTTSREPSRRNKLTPIQHDDTPTDLLTQNWPLTLASLLLLLPDELQSFVFAQKGLIASPGNCPNCDTPMHEGKNKSKLVGIEFRCDKCHKRQSPLTDTIFEQIRTTLRKLLLLIYCFCKKEPVTSAAIECEIDRKTACRYYSYFRWVRAAIVTNESAKRIGGRGMTVELDEAYVCRRKDNKGRFLKHQQVWLFGGVCRETQDVFAVVVKKRDKNTLLPLIKRFIAKHSNIYTDMWPPYQSIPEELASMEYTHQAVNHSKNFLNPENSDWHTQTKERGWLTERRYIAKTSTVDNLESYNFLYLYAVEFEGD